MSAILANAMRSSVTTTRMLALFLFFGSSIGLEATGKNPASQSDVPEAKAVIFGQVIDQDGQPAKGIMLTACPLDKILATALPSTITDQDGNFRFERLFGWGKYTVYADDPTAGYSDFSQDPDYRASPRVVTLRRRTMPVVSAELHKSIRRGAPFKPSFGLSWAVPKPCQAPKAKEIF